MHHTTNHQTAKTQSKTKYAVPIIAVVLVTLLVFAPLQTTAEITGDTLVFSASFGLSKTSLALQDIATVQYVENFTRGSRTFGMATQAIQTGTFKNANGSYTLCAMKAVPACIVLTLHSGKMYAFNAQSPQTTQQIFTQLQKLLS